MFFICFQAGYGSKPDTAPGFMGNPDPDPVFFRSKSLFIVDQESIFFQQKIILLAVSYFKFTFLGHLFLSSGLSIH
jgi:hypothetical protein